ncbi:ATP-binding protein, partial [Candidatus Auribacterota bacterium]
LWDTITSGMEWKGEFHNRKKNGELYWEYQSISPIKNVNGDITHYLAIKEDITGRKNMEEKLRKVNEELRSLSEAKSDFISIVSHEMRAPLTFLKGVVGQLLRGAYGEVSDHQRKFFSLALSDIDHLGRIISNLLDISKIESGRLVLRRDLVNIVRISQDVCGTLENVIKEKGLELRQRYSKEEIMLYGDRDLIAQVFTNLINNASKYTNSGYIEVDVKDDDKGVTCSINDTGIGIEEKDVSQIFDKYKQVGKKTITGDRGVGLGLSIAKGIVELLKGKIFVKSKLNHGSQFVFVLPRLNLDGLLGEFVVKTIGDARKIGEQVQLELIKIKKTGNKTGKEKFVTAFSNIEREARNIMREECDIVVRNDTTVYIIISDSDDKSLVTTTELVVQKVNECLSEGGISRAVSIARKTLSYPEDGKDEKEILVKLFALK